MIPKRKSECCITFQNNISCVDFFNVKIFYTLASETAKNSFNHTVRQNWPEDNSQQVVYGK